MSRRFRICMAKGGRESARPSYGRPKLTLNSRGEKKPKTVFPKTLRPQFSYFSLEIESAVFWYTRPKPAYGRQGLDWDRWARIQFSQVHFGAKLDSTDLLWCKNVTSPTGGSNRPFRCLEEGGRALPKFLAPFQNVSKKHSGYDLLLNKYSGGFREITILM